MCSYVLYPDWLLPRKDADRLLLCNAVETTQIQTKMLHLQRLGLMRYNSAHRLFSLQPPLRPVLLDVVQQQPDMYSHAVLGLAQCCMEACSLASAVFASHAQVGALSSSSSSPWLSCWLKCCHACMHQLAFSAAHAQI